MQVDQYMERRIFEMHQDGYIELFQVHGERSWRLTDKGWLTFCAAAERRAKPRKPTRHQLKCELEDSTIVWIK